MVFFVGRGPYLHLPSLLGMLVAGFLLRNVRGIDLARHIDKRWSNRIFASEIWGAYFRQGLVLRVLIIRVLRYIAND